MCGVADLAWAPAAGVSEVAMLNGEGRWSAAVCALGLLGGLAAAEAAPLDDRFTAVVTASRTEMLPSESPVPLSVLSRADIERSGARDLAELLALDPAVRIERGVGGAGVSIQ